jgi:peptidylprolyl isomerase
MSKVENGNNIKVHYKGTLNNGEQFDSSYDRGNTLDFTVGAGQMIKGFDTAVVGMGVGDTKKVTLAPAEAYGLRNEKAIQTVPKTAFPPEFAPKINETVQGQTQDGKPLIAKVLEIEDETIKLDLNHPLAGEDLTFDIELVEIV